MQISMLSLMIYNMVYTKKKYLKELKTNPYWEIEPHFFHWLMREMFQEFRTAIKNKMTPQDLQGAVYGEFVIRGKPMLDGFIQGLNSDIKWLGEILNKHSSLA